ncbi:SNF2 family N-terminal domain-containing protein [Trametes maxima]|nr:SNF2 family N-terminal domain-containing protein [Trametes maxima]
MSTPSSRSVRSSSGTPALPSTRATSPPSSPPAVEEVEDDEKLDESAYQPVSDEKEDEEFKTRLTQLTTFLDRSAKYIELLQDSINSVHKKDKPKEERESKRAKLNGRGKGKATVHGHDGDVKEETPAFEQPALLTGATLKDYQLQGVAWMAGLHKNGISGILADEMGLGKTIQTIAFHAYLRERTPAPFMVVCPLAVLDNWAREFQRFAPDIPVVVYYGTKEERAEIRRTKMTLGPADRNYLNKAMKGAVEASKASPAAASTRGRGRGRGNPRGSGSGRGSTRGRGGKNVRARQESDSEAESEVEVAPSRPRGKTTTRGRGRGRRTVPQKRAREPLEEAASSEFEDSITVEEDKPPQQLQTTDFPVVLTTYQIIINDRAELSKYHWGFIVVDEGHRLKNIDCVLMQQIKKIPAAARMVLTGTPLQNNLAELWALLNFVLPELFQDREAFQYWFDEGKLPSQLSSQQQSGILYQLHDLLRPFLLRRMKADVEMQLPPKKEYVLYTPLTEQQRELYEVAVQGDKSLRAHLISQMGEEAQQGNGGDSESEEEKPLQDASLLKAKTKGKGLRTTIQKTYVDDSDDEDYFKRLEERAIEARKERERNDREIGRQWQRRTVVREVNNKNLKNVIMQLRKVCQHPFLFHWPKDPVTRELVLNEELVNASGKMMVLERLLDALFARGHKVLLFSQFTTMLDIIEDWAVERKGWPVCRIDGSMDMESRREDIRRFQEGGDAPDAPRLFLLSTRSGGLGLNLVAADTVIFYDQDWNPQADLQAQDRAHRIGQTKPVLIFRLICAHTIEMKIMERATQKRKLETLVIAKGEFKNPTAAKRSEKHALAELAMELHRLEGEKIQVVSNTEADKARVISDADLEVLLDRRPEVFVDRRKGWTSSGQVGDADSTEGAAPVPDVAASAKTKTAFAVYEAPAAEGNVLGMMGGDSDEDEE